MFPSAGEGRFTNLATDVSGKKSRKREGSPHAGTCSQEWERGRGKGEGTPRSLVASSVPQQPPAKMDVRRGAVPAPQRDRQLKLRASAKTLWGPHLLPCRGRGTAKPNDQPTNRPSSQGGDDKQNIKNKT